MATGIKDRVAILGMGCSKFGERWDADSEMLMIEAFSEAIADAGIEKDRIEAAWFATAYENINVGKSAIPLSMALRLPFIPVTRVENYCASGSEAFRGAVYAVASGACDVALALGVEKLKDTGYGGLPQTGGVTLNNMYYPGLSAPGAFAQLASAYQRKHNVSLPDLKQAMAHVSVKSHDNGAKNEKAHLRNKITVDRVLKAPMVAEPLGVFDCCGVSDGAACAIVTTPEIAKNLGKSGIVRVKALQIAVSNGTEAQFNAWDGASVQTTQVASSRAYREAGVTNPRDEVSLLEVHDCFSITELVTMEDLHISPEGGAVKDIRDGFYDATGQIPCQIDGGLKCFGHPIGASGLRMLYEMYLQLQGKAGMRQVGKEPKLGLTHNLGGFPHQNVCSVCIVGL